MRQLAVRWFALTLMFSTVPVLAARTSPELQGRGSVWLDSARDYIERKPTKRPKESCGSPVACSLVMANAGFRCDSVAGSKLFAARPTLHLYGSLYFHDGRLQEGVTPTDQSVTDGDSAITHEYEWHIIPAALGVVPLLEALQAARFDSRASCENAGRATSEAVLAAFRDRLAETQRHEIAFGTRLVERIAWDLR